eukprot:CAMPEP_0202700674 /NCGR_PEP_ID=MMETSP1385-20130828/13851_1 /ASSEMBLY_ACC=CAM_ASM_000861 /TAXON_ID=933848 /ORGANISM="Elphidium margaritaceum" /LENGTH=338 /DNA_ID=CAMNT_0049357919 /DNA_START=38 /DNA_END=1054 /DNA_ORIENTATION=-
MRVLILVLAVCCRSCVIEFVEDVYSSNDMYLSWKACAIDGGSSEQALQYRKCGEKDFKAAAIHNISTLDRPNTFAATLNDVVPGTVYEVQFLSDHNEKSLYRVRSVSVTDDWESYLQEIEPYLIVGAAVSIGAVVLEPIALDLLGFGTVGITADSLAAFIQSEIGDVAAGSVFASLQSAGMTTDILGESFLGVALHGLGLIAASTDLSRDECGNDWIESVQRFVVMNINDIDLNEMQREIGDYINNGVELIGQEANEVGKFVADGLDDAGNYMGEAADDVTNAVGDAAVDAGNYMTGAAVQAGDYVTGEADEISNSAQNAAKDAGDFFKKGLGGVFVL